MTQEPTMDEKAKNFVRSATSVIQSIMRGNDLFCKTEVREERQRICEACEYRDPNTNMCLTCGCALKFKIPFAASECPQQKWGMDTATIEEEVLKRVQKD